MSVSAWCWTTPPEITDLVLDDPEENGDEKDVLTFQDVSFRFADAEEYTLRNLNFTCRRGGNHRHHRRHRQR